MREVGKMREMGCSTGNMLRLNTQGGFNILKVTKKDNLQPASTPIKTQNSKLFPCSLFSEKLGSKTDDL